MTPTRLQNIRETVTAARIAGWITDPPPSAETVVCNSGKVHSFDYTKIKREEVHCVHCGASKPANARKKKGKGL